MYQIEFHHGLRVRSDTLVPFMISSLVQKFTFESLRKFRKGKIHVFRPTCGSGFSCYRVMVNSKYFLLRRTRSLVSHARQLKVLFCQFNGAPLLCPFLVVCCIHIIYILPLACCFISSSLKNDSLSSGVQGQVGHCPGLETGLEQSCSNPHHLIIWECHHSPDNRTHTYIRYKFQHLE